jgi:hypothetical protein
MLLDVDVVKEVNLREIRKTKNQIKNRFIKCLNE